jgi:predicted methyltransferase
MPRLTELAHEAVRARLGPGDVAIDATAGNGHDTHFLSDLVGPTGSVFAFDVQVEALARTATRLGGRGNVTLRERDHAELRDSIPVEHHGRVGAVMFNLGYLPGGDHSLTTRTRSTVAGVAAALELLRPGGVLAVVAYTGHPGGAEEADAVGKLLRESPHAFLIHEHQGNHPSPAPRLFVVHKRSASG